MAISTFFETVQSARHAKQVVCLLMYASHVAENMRTDGSDMITAMKELEVLYSLQFFTENELQERVSKVINASFVTIQTGVD